MRFEKMIIKNAKSVWQNPILAFKIAKLTFKILRFLKNTIFTCDLKNHIFYIFKSQFLKM
jgi:hypothetical protein